MSKEGAPQAAPSEDALAGAPEPWERWESRNCENNVWSDLGSHPRWFTHREYRRKQRTININGYEVPEPLRKLPEDDEDVYIANPEIGDALPVLLRLRGTHAVKTALESGFLHATRDAAIQHAEALRSFTKLQTEQ